LEKQKAAGIPKKLVGFTIAEKSFPRHGYKVFVNGTPSGEVRSGTMSPTLGIAIGTAYVPTAHAKTRNTLEVEIRDKRLKGTVVELPFYKSGTHRGVGRQTAGGGRRLGRRKADGGPLA